MRRQLGPVVRDDHPRAAAQLDEPVEFTSDPPSGQRGVGHERQTLPGEVVDDHQHPEQPPIRQNVGHEVEAPALVRPLRQRHRAPRAESALSTAASPHRQLFLSIEPKELLVIEDDALPPQQDLEAAMAEAPTFRRERSQTRSDASVVDA